MEEETPEPLGWGVGIRRLRSLNHNHGHVVVR